MNYIIKITFLAAALLGILAVAYYDPTPEVFGAFIVGLGFLAFAAVVGFILSPRHRKDPNENP